MLRQEKVHYCESCAQRGQVKVYEEQRVKNFCADVR